MKRRAFFFGILLTVLLPLITQAASTDTVQRFSSMATITPNGDAQVTETILYSYAGTDRHGFYRTIPLANGESVTDLSIVNASGNPVLFQTSTLDNSLQLQIGDPAVTVRGLHKYTLRYMLHQVLIGDNVDWPVTMAWEVPINRTTATLVLPYDAGLTVGCTIIAASTTACPTTATTVDHDTTTITATTDALIPGSDVTLHLVFMRSMAPTSDTTTSAPLAAISKNTTSLSASTIFGVIILVMIIGVITRRRRTTSPPLPPNVSR